MKSWLAAGSIIIGLAVLGCFLLKGPVNPPRSASLRNLESYLKIADVASGLKTIRQAAELASEVRSSETGRIDPKQVRRMRSKTRKLAQKLQETPGRIRSVPAENESPREAGELLELAALRYAKAMEFLEQGVADGPEFDLHRGELLLDEADRVYQLFGYLLDAEKRSETGLSTEVPGDKEHSDETGELELRYPFEPFAVEEDLVL